MKRFTAILLMLSTSITSVSSEHLTVFAAASTTEAMNELAGAFKAEYGEGIHFNFSSSGALARQIAAGAPADLFISANSQWMDWLEEHSAIDPATRFNLAANALVLIAPSGSNLQFNGHIEGRVAVGDFKSVPAGIYAEQALTHMGWMDQLRPNLIMASNVRTALMYVERGEVAAGIVYATDAKASNKVSIIGTFPSGSHSPIIYPVATCRDVQKATRFLNFLRSPEARVILKKHGFK
jgi:molybdate transport system substrate-binding protein